MLKLGLEKYISQEVKDLMFLPMLPIGDLSGTVMVRGPGSSNCANCACLPSLLSIGRPSSCLGRCSGAGSVIIGMGIPGPCDACACGCASGGAFC